MAALPLPEDYRPTPPEDAKKAQVFFTQGARVASAGQFEYAIEMYVQGFVIDPEAVEAHQALRDISLKRKASGGKPIPMVEAFRLRRPSKDDKQNMLNAEKLLAFDPGETDYMVSILQNAHRGGFYKTVEWIGPILLQANADSKSPDYSKHIILKDIYRSMRWWKLAVEACHKALELRPMDMDLQTEEKNLGAQLTMESGKYGEAGSFKDSVRDLAGQQNVLAEEKDVRTEDVMMRVIKDAYAQYKAEPDEIGKLQALCDALERTDSMEYENKALDLLESAYKKNGVFRLRRRIGQIKMKQMSRMERAMRTDVAKSPDDQRLMEDLEAFRKDRAEFELAEYTLWAENYPTDMTLRYEMAMRMFALKRYDEAIPVFQSSRQDPKLRFKAGLHLGRAFLEAGFVDEAIETLQGGIDEYQLRGDDVAKELNYWQGRALEKKGTNDAALKRYSQVAQWDFGYRDVQGRIKKLRGVV